MQEPKAAAHPGVKNIRTLLVDPDAQTRQIIEFELSVRGQSVVVRHDAASALSAFHDNIFQCVVISSQLPDGDALRLCRNLRALPGGDAVGIAIVGHKLVDSDRDDAIDAGADAVIALTTGGGPMSDDLDRVEEMLSKRTGAGAAADQESSALFLVINPNGTIRTAAPVAERLLGFPPEAIAGVNAFSFFHPDHASRLLSIISEAFNQPRQTRAIEVRVRLDGDSWRTIAISAVNTSADPGIQGVVFELRGPEANVDTDDQVTRAAMHDRLTDLPTRSLFIDRVDHAVVRSTRRQHPIVVMAIDFDHYATGDGQAKPDVDDGLIVAVAQRLRSCLRSSDTASRLEHDQFGVLLEDIVTIDNASIVAGRIISAMAVPFVSNGAELTLTTHIGITASSPGRHRAIDLLRDAGIARAWARIQGSGSHVMFDLSMQPPDGEQATSEFQFMPVAAPLTSVDDRLDELNQRIASLEQTLAHFAHVSD